MNFLEFLEELNYLMELINLMSLWEAPPLFDLGCEAEGTEDEKASLTSVGFYNEESLYVYNKWDSTFIAGDFFETNKQLGSSENGTNFLESVFENSSDIWESNSENKAALRESNFAAADASQKEPSFLRESLLRESLCGNSFYGGGLWSVKSLHAALEAEKEKNAISEALTEGERAVRDNAYYAEGYVRGAENYIYNRAEREKTFNGIFTLISASLAAEKENIAGNYFYLAAREKESALLNMASSADMYHKPYSNFVKYENILGEYEERREVLNADTNEVYCLRDSSLAERLTRQSEAALINSIVYHKRDSNIKELIRLEAGADEGAVVKQLIRRDESNKNRGNVNVNVDFKAYAQLSDDYDTERFARVFAKYLEGQLEGCAEGLHF